MNKAFDRIKREFENNPLAVIFIASMAATATAKLVNASTEARNSRTWKKEVDRRVVNTRRR